MSVQTLSAQPLARVDHRPAMQIINQPEQIRLLILEDKISHCGSVPDKLWLNDYLDLGLELACRAGERRLLKLQTSWLRRIYRTFTAAALNTDAPAYWRAVCSDYLYQPYFALLHLYRKNPADQQQLKCLMQEFSSVCRCCEHHSRQRPMKNISRHQ